MSLKAVKMRVRPFSTLDIRSEKCRKSRRRRAWASSLPTAAWKALGTAHCVSSSCTLWLINSTRFKSIMYLRVNAWSGFCGSQSFQFLNLKIPIGDALAALQQGSFRYAGCLMILLSITKLLTHEPLQAYLKAGFLVLYVIYGGVEHITLVAISSATKVYRSLEPTSKW